MVENTAEHTGNGYDQVLNCGRILEKKHDELECFF